MAQGGNSLLPMNALPQGSWPIGSLSNDDGDVNENGKIKNKTKTNQNKNRSDSQNNNPGRAPRFFVDFFAVTARLHLYDVKLSNL